jgi:DNA-3-methyladenine glycosylase II
MEQASFTLQPVPPFSLELTVWALRRRPGNQVDRWDGSNYSRIFTFGGNKPFKVSASQGGGPERPELNVSISRETAINSPLKSGVSSMMQEMFSLGRDLSDFYSLARRDKKLTPLVERFAGMKPPRFPTVFEALVNAFACQQVSLDLGIILLNRLSLSYGPVFREDKTVFHGFPGPEDLAVLSPDDFRSLGFSLNKGRAIIELSQDVMDGKLDIGSLEKMTDIGSVRYLSGIRGVGRWTAEYVLLRGLGRINVFPGDDVGAQRNLGKFMGLAERPDYDKIKKITSRWQPYAGFVYFHLLLDKLMTRGYLT